MSKTILVGLELLKCRSNTLHAKNEWNSFSADGRPTRPRKVNKKNTKRLTIKAYLNNPIDNLYSPLGNINFCSKNLGVSEMAILFVFIESLSSLNQNLIEDRWVCLTKILHRGQFFFQQRDF